MKITRTVGEARAWMRQQRDAGKSVGFVPTMGALHEGHVSLVRASVAENDATVVSIFVNPTQFGPMEDLSKYPRPFERDVALCEEAGAVMVYAPPPEVVYPPGYATYVDVQRLTDTLCGAKRPGHFRGVATVVTKLFNTIRADRAYFGQKDAQQVRVIQQLVRDLDLEVEVRVCPILREADGLAMSSRNAYLAPEERRLAPVLYQALQAIERLYHEGEDDVHRLRELALALINRERHAYVDYVEVVSPDTLQPLDRAADGALVALAVRIGPARLIDNLTLGKRPPSAPSPAKGPAARTSRPSRAAPASKGRSTARRK